MERTVLKLLLDKTGLAADEQYKKMMEGDAADIPVTDAVAGALLSKLLTVEDAVKHPAVEKALKPVILKAVDDKALETLTKAGLSEADAKALIDGKSTPDKFQIVSDKLHELGKGDSSKTATEREKAWELTKTQLEKDLKTAKDATAAATTAAENLKFGYDFRDFVTSAEKSGVKLNKALPVDTQVRLIKEDLLAQAAAKNLTVKFEAGKIVYYDADNKVYHEPGVATPYDARLDVEKVVTTLGLIEKTPGGTSPENPVNPPPRDPNAPEADLVSSRSVNTNADLISKALGTGPATPDTGGVSGL